MSLIVIKCLECRAINNCFQCPSKSKEHSSCEKPVDAESSCLYFYIECLK